MKSFRTFANIRPPDLPKSWSIYNAPRPLPGSRTWEADFLRGCHYSAVDPEDERKAEILHGIDQLDGWQAVECSEDAFQAWLMRQIAEYHYIGPVDSVLEPMRLQYLELGWGLEVPKELPKYDLHQ